MSGRLRILLLLCCFCVCGVQAEEAIQSYDVRLQVELSGEVLVTERIAVIAEGQQISRGIYRDIPTRYSLGKGLLRSTPLTLISATRDGQPESVTQQALEHGVRLRLGRADVRLQPGPYVYELIYRMDAQLQFHARVDELYWNVTGNDWRLPIRQASVEVLLPEGAQIEAAHAYTGYRGSREGAYKVVEQQGNRLRLVTTRELKVGEGFTVATAWPAGLVSRPSWWQNLLRLVIDNLRDILSLLVCVGLVGFYLYLWWTIGRGPRKGLVIPLFELPRGISPAMAGYVWHRGPAGDPRGVRALSIMLTDLAIRGWLRLQRNAEGLLLTRAEAPGDAIREDERRVLNALIASEDGSLTLSNRYEPRLTTALDGLLRSFEVIEHNNFNRHTGEWLIGVCFAFVASFISLVTTPADSAATSNAFWLMVVGAGLGAWGVSLLRSAHAGAGVLLVLLMLVLAICAASQVGGPAVLLCLILFVIVMVARTLLRAPSIAGRRLLDELEGYREYLSLAEKDVLDKAGQAPVMSIAHYERHLPYAMALGVERQWTERFTYELRKGTLAPVEVDYQPQAFTQMMASGAAHSLAWNLDRMLMSSSTPPQAPRSSDDFSPSGGGGSGSSSSASHGGGSSGGGAGGGGGGGW